VRGSLEAINGIGHAAVLTDLGFRAALAARGFTVDAESGEILELASYVGPFSARAAQIGRNTDRYEAEWPPSTPTLKAASVAARPDRHPGVFGGLGGPSARLPLEHPRRLDPPAHRRDRSAHRHDV
jgi:hypothetical protein